jgi:hypothetical protein
MRLTLLEDINDRLKPYTPYRHIYTKAGVEVLNLTELDKDCRMLLVTEDTQIVGLDDVKKAKR